MHFYSRIRTHYYWYGSNVYDLLPSTSLFRLFPGAIWNQEDSMQIYQNYKSGLCLGSWNARKVYLMVAVQAYITRSNPLKFSFTFERKRKKTIYSMPQESITISKHKYSEENVSISKYVSVITTISHTVTFLFKSLLTLLVSNILINCSPPRI